MVNPVATCLTVTPKLFCFHLSGFIILYIIYVLVVIIGRVLYQRYKRKLRQRTSIQTDLETSYQNVVCNGPQQPAQRDFEQSIRIITNGDARHAQRNVGKKFIMFI